MVLKYKDGDLMNEKKIVLNEAQKMLVEKERILKQETDKLSTIKKLNEKYSSIEEEISQNLKKVSEILKQEKEIYEKIQNEIRELNQKVFTDDLNVNLKLVFDNESYSKDIENILNMNNRQDDLELYKYLSEKEKIEFENFNDMIFQHYKNLILLDNKKIKLKKNREKKELIELVLKNYIRKNI